MNRANHRLNAVSILVPLTGTLAAVLMLPGAAPSASTILIAVVFFLLNALGVGLGLHRYFTHHAFRTGRVLAALLGVLGSAAIQGPLARWVADHRRHHRFTDRPHDTHSPYWRESEPIDNPLAGWLHSHILWMLTGSRSCERRYAPDILADPVSAWCTRNYWGIAAGSLLAPGIAAALASPDDAAIQGLMGVLWGGCVRVSVLHQLTWSVNSFGHTTGRKLPAARDESRNNLPLTILLLGEGLHSYHHRWPTAAVNQPLALDPMGWLVLALQQCGLVWNVRAPEQDRRTAA